MLKSKKMNDFRKFAIILTLTVKKIKTSNFPFKGSLIFGRARDTL